MMVSFALAVVVALNTALPVLAQGVAIVNIEPGSITGSKCPATDVNSFLSIPYAQPPIGDLRFASPQAYNGSYPSGIINATTPAPACIQFGSQFIIDGPQSEDCLYIDIWAPKNATNSSTLPVKVWLYGGAFDAGEISDPLYNGCNLGTDAIVVSVAYRVGALGFLALEPAGITGNFGIQDILLALEWIQQNVGAFGGDPAKVLLFGQSAGAGLTWIISTLPQASTLINAAISESDSGRTLVSYEAYQAYGTTYSNNLGCSITNISCFKAANVTALNASAPVTPATTITSPDKFQPCLDGKIVPAEPLTVGSQVHFLSGTNTMEGNLFTISQFSNPKTISATDYSDFLASNFQSIAPIVAKAYPLSLFSASPIPAFSAISTVITYSSYFCPARRSLEATMKYSPSRPVYSYQSSHSLSCPWEPFLVNVPNMILGPTHTSEIPLVFRQLSGLPLPNGNCTLTSQEVAISSVLTSAWSSMAENGSPNGGVSILGGPWPAWNATASQGLLISNLTAVGYINYTVCDFWDRVEAARVNALSGNGSAVGNATATSSGPSGTSTSSQAITTGGGNVLRMAFPIILSTTFVVFFSILLSV